jgi:hypothetical protein
MIEEGEQVRAAFAISLSQAAGIAGDGCQRHHRVEFAFQPVSIVAACGLRQMMAPPGQHEGSQ